MSKGEKLTFAISFFEKRLKDDDFKYGERPAVYIALDALREQYKEKREEPLTVEELKKLSAKEWIWIEVLQPFEIRNKVSAYYRKSGDSTSEDYLTAGWPGNGYGFDYADYGSTWIAYLKQPRES